jgi:hypothetical protein
MTTYVIPAECHSDDNRVKILFDALPWFKQASDGEINALIEECFDGGYACDGVAEHFSDTTTADLFDYLVIVNKHTTEGIGFECRGDLYAAVAWLQANRPDIVNLPRTVAVTEGGEIGFGI